MSRESFLGLVFSVSQIRFLFRAVANCALVSPVIRWSFSVWIENITGVLSSFFAFGGVVV